MAACQSGDLFTEDSGHNLSQELRAKLDVGVTPFAYGIDTQGIVRAKGLVNTRGQLDEMARASVGKAGERSQLTDLTEEVHYFSKGAGA